MNENAMNLVEKLDEKYGNAIPIFGGAVWVDGFEKLISGLSHVIRTAEFFGWCEPPADACRTFCHICGYDPALVESYIEMRFEQLIKGVN